MTDATIIVGDCLPALRARPAMSVDSVVTDPPAGINFMGKTWDGAKGGRDAWVAWLQEVMVECRRVLKPGGHALVWALPRTSHWTATAVENAGLEIRDRIAHLFSTGAPKSPGVPAVLKPACEDWWLARVPLVGTLNENIERYGTGGLNVDACRVAYANARDLAETKKRNPGRGGELVTSGVLGARRPQQKVNAEGRWPPNVVLSHDSETCCVVKMLDEELGASRFFYVTKPTRTERNAGCELLPRHEDGEGNHHPTVKSIALMRWLCRLVTPPGGIVLDPFAGSGSTGCGAILEGRAFVGIEREPGYAAIARARLAYWKRNMLNG